MHLTVIQNGRTVNEFNFEKGPVYIGRQKDSQVVLPDRTISRQHAVLYTTQEGRWVLEDLDSTNKTYLNGKSIHKSDVNTGDRVRIGEYRIEIDLETPAENEEPVRLEDTLTKTSYGDVNAGTVAPAGRTPILRKPRLPHGPALNLPPRRIKDFLRATEAVCRADTVEEVLKVLLKVAGSQFAAYRTWAALRSQPSGPMLAQGGRKPDGMEVELEEIALREQVMEAVKTGEFALYPDVPAQERRLKVKSAIIVPVLDLEGTFGVLYVDNDTAHARFNLSDLDYSVFLSIHTASVLENF